MPRQKNKICYFCTNQIDEIDYKDIQTLGRFTSSYQKIKPRRRTGICMKHQRKLAQAIKRARFMGLIPYTQK